MKYDDNFSVKKPKQERAQKAIEDILDSAQELSDEGLIELLNARALSEKSGYSVGTIYRYFEKFDDILFTQNEPNISRNSPIFLMRTQQIFMSFVVYIVLVSKIQSE
jgi:AcrR family transcriptional regulator